MLKYLPMQSGSAGNGALLWDEETLLVLDAAVSVEYAETVLNKHKLKLSDFNNIKVIVTHGHGDHTKHLRQWRNYPVIAPFDITVNPLHELDFRTKEEKENSFEVNAWAVGKFEIYKFEVKHDVRNWGYRIEHPDGVIVWMTDVAELPKEPHLDFFKNADVYLIEANWSLFLKPKGLTDREKIRYNSNKRRHLSNMQAQLFLEKNMGANTKHVHFLHLGSNTDQLKLVVPIVEALFKKGYPQTTKYTFLEYSKTPNGDKLMFTINENPITQFKLNNQEVI